MVERLSHLPNTQKVPGSIPDGIIILDKVLYISQGDKMKIQFLHKIESNS